MGRICHLVQSTIGAVLHGVRAASRPATRSAVESQVVLVLALNTSYIALFRKGWVGTRGRWRYLSAMNVVFLSQSQSIMNFRNLVTCLLQVKHAQQGCLALPRTDLFELFRIRWAGTVMGVGVVWEWKKKSFYFPSFNF